MRIRVTIDFETAPSTCPLTNEPRDAIHDADGFRFRVAPSQSALDALRVEFADYDTATYEVLKP